MKDYDTWNEIKKIQECKDRDKQTVFCKEREIWWIILGLNLGDEEDGKGLMFERPVLIIKKFNNNLFWGCAFLTKIKENNPYYIKVNTESGMQSVIVSQLRLHDTKRLSEKMGVLNNTDFQKVKTAIIRLL